MHPPLEEGIPSLLWRLFLVSGQLGSLGGDVYLSWVFVMGSDPKISPRAPPPLAKKVLPEAVLTRLRGWVLFFLHGSREL